VAQQRPDWLRGTQYDALILGNGPAACILALQMVRRGKAALLALPRNQGKAGKPFGETLSSRGEFILSSLGVADHCLADQDSFSETLSCWRSPSPEIANLDFDPHGQLWHINRNIFDRVLVRIAIEAGAEILDQRENPRFRFDRHGDGWRIHIDSFAGEYLALAKYIVDATGRSAFFARHLGRKRILRDRLAALWCVREHFGDACPLLIEPVRQGWWYSLSLRPNTLLAALVTDPHAIDLSKPRRKVLWDSTLNEAPHTKSRFGVERGLLSVASIESARLDRMSGDRWLAIGDAASSFDPLSSHGLCSAIEQATEASDLLCSHADHGALEEFEVKRRGLFNRYAVNRVAVYKSMHRFSECKFWQRRVEVQLP
jgi:flavin-dependent dehydrogenase